MGSITPDIQTLEFVTLDVFTTTPYEGNPLALVKIPASLRRIITQEKKQAIAREFNLSETVFLHEQLDREIPEWDLDIFTTNDELPFAGHPTIGSASYVLGLVGIGKGKDRRAGTGVFVTKAGKVPISRSSSYTGMRVHANIPHDVHVHQHIIGDLNQPIPGLSSDPVLMTAEMQAPIVSIMKGMTFLLVRLPSLEMLGQVQMSSPDLSFHGMLDGKDGWNRGFVARYYFVVLGHGSTNGHHGNGDVEMTNGNGNRNGNGNGRGHQADVVRIRTRMLEVEMEDPATGSAACALGSFLALQTGRSTRFEVTQGVEMERKSVIGVEVALDEAGRRVEDVRLSGDAVLVMEGTLRI